MAGRFPDSIRGKHRVTPLMTSSFSRLGESSLNRTADSGYQSSIASSSRSFTPLSDVSDSSRLYCSTPLTEDSILSHQISNSTVLLETPVQPVLPNRTYFSEDRIPSTRASLPVNVDAIDYPSDVLSCLIRSHSIPAIQRVFRCLADEDLMRLCQVSDDYCRAVCECPPALKRLSKFLIVSHQNGENRTTSSHNNIENRPHRGILRPIQNVMVVGLPSGTVWTVPSPLEAIDMSRVPHQFRTLVCLTKTLSEHHCVIYCRACRCLVAVRSNQQKTEECTNCNRFRRTKNSRLVTKTKASLFR
ncbi:uncharacterized protein LOC116929732 [Daphnia magna]|uniref:Uncharacterized protein n=2 Tax=Daphnia magna TaxID=35525 RepID=A0ABR0B7N8_9CRUS|nr:uncharacterized protein LOC116929732 [Daphnia magna]KAK4037708.1 hypothetical protein OUZ56_029738 [Daphnia magna]KZS05666.1 Uncharacterized protein APZ42_031080 [Daphnia magna]